MSHNSQIISGKRPIYQTNHYFCDKISINPVEITQTRISINLANELEFRRLFDSFYVPLCVFANKYVQNEEVAADIVQESFMVLWQIRTDFFYLHQVKAFLFTTIRNKALNEIEHSKVVSEYADKIIAKKHESFFYDNIVEEEVYRTLTDAIDKLPKQMKTIMLLALEGMSNGEIAQQLDVSIETVRSLKKIAYRKLRTLLDGYYYLLFLFIQPPF